MTSPSRMLLTAASGTDFWNDSCSVRELSEAVTHGAVGATSNPVIVFTVIKQEPERWLPVIDAFVRDNSTDSEDDIAWKLIETVGIEAARILQPVYERHGRKKGRLSLQVNPILYRDPERMVEHAKRLSSLAPNIAVKLPCTEAGLRAVEAATASGVTVNVTVSFSVPQVVGAAEAIERGLQQAQARGISTDAMTPYVTMMVGRLDDHLKRVMARENIVVDPGMLEWAGVACFKKAYAIFQERGYRGTLLSAAYRNHMHWSEFIGGHVVLSMPYEWWNRFNACDIEVCPRINNPVNEQIVETLYGTFNEFRRAYDEKGMTVAEFVHYGATIHTLNQFIGGYRSLLELIRDRMLR